jgi:hypothetical protein
MAVQLEQKPKILHVKVTDHSRPDRPVVNVKVPISLVKWGMKVGAAFSPEMKEANLDWDSVTAAIESGELGKIAEVEDEAQQKTVEVWVE